MQKKSPNNSGFTLIEVMVALVLLLIMSLGTLLGLMKTMHSINRNQYREEAKQIAQLKLDETLARPYADIANVTTTTNAIRVWGESEKTFTITETVNETFANEGKTISVIVSWEIISGNTESITVTSLRGNR